MEEEEVQSAEECAPEDPAKEAAAAMVCSSLSTPSRKQKKRGREAYFLEIVPSKLQILHLASRRRRRRVQPPNGRQPFFSGVGGVLVSRMGVTLDTSLSCLLKLHLSTPSSLSVLFRRGRCVSKAFPGYDRSGVPREQKMLKGHLPRVIYHQVYWYMKIKVAVC